MLDRPDWAKTLQINGTHCPAHEIPTVLFGRKQPLSYVLNPKSACTLALNFVFFLNNGYRYFDPIQIHYSRAALLKLKGPELDPRIAEAYGRLAPQSFSLVRDPLRRFVSGFVSKVFSAEDPYYMSYRDLLTSVCGIDLSPEANAAQTCLTFARWIASQPDQNQIDAHFRPQYLNLMTEGGFAIDTIVRLEDKDALLAFFSKWIGAEKAEWFLTFRFNATKSADDEIVTDELKKLVRQIYARDYELFYS